jgi:hypothetical protein
MATAEINCLGESIGKIFMVLIFFYECFQIFKKIHQQLK